MSSGTITPPPRPAEPQPERPSYEAFIEDRLRRTRRQVKGVDIAGGLVVLAIGTLAYLLAAVVIDHWVISGGLGFWGRLLLLTGLLAGAGYFFALHVLMPLIYRINPIFAAHTIEQSRPSLKNSLINFLLLRGHRREVPQPVYRAIEHRAAADLSQIEIEAAVDRTHVIRLGYVLVGTLALCCLYLVLSPKSLLTSAARVLWPWSGIPVPTRVTIEEVKPGDAVAFHGEFVTVSAEVRGAEGETVALYYSTADGQTVNQRIPMTPPEDGYRHQCKLPPEELGLQQDVNYYLTAGDYTTRRFSVDVQTAPAILIDAIEYDYPAYTGFPKRIENRQEDIRAIEGTVVTIRATANRAIHWAKIDLGCNGLHELDMRPKGKTATGRFTLRLHPHDPNLPEHDSYQLRFRDDAGRLNPRPTRHRIEVIRDLPPEIQLLDPQQEDVQLAEDGQLQIRVRAEDPDFALRKVVLRAECDGRNVVIPPMLDKLHPGGFLEGYLFEPAKARFESDASQPALAGLKAGDRVRYWAEAEDNKQPTPGRSTTAQQWITIVKPPSRQPPPEQPDGAAQDAGQRTQDNDNQDGPPDRQPDEDQQPQEDPPQDPAEKPEPGDESTPQEDGSKDQGQQEDSPGQQRQSDDPSEPIDAETQPGDAIDKILEHREQQQKEPGEEPSGGQKPGEKQPGEEPSGGQKPGEKQPGEEPSGGQKPGEKQPGEEPSGGQKPGEKQPGEEPSGGQKPGEKQPGEEPSGGQKPGEKQPGEEPSGGQKPGEKQPGEEPSGGQKPGEKQPGEEPSGGQKPGEKQPGEEPSGGQKSGEKQPGEEPSGGKPQPGREPDTQQSPGAGKPSKDETGPPEAQGPNAPREKKSGEPGQNPAEKQPADSPSISPHESDSQGDPGDRSGGGEKGGGQRSKQPGTGADGSQTEADKGGSAGKQPGDGQTGTRGGSQVETDQKTGSSATRRGGPGSDGSQQPGDIGPGERKNAGDDSGGAERPQEKPTDGGRPGSGSPSGPNARGQGNPTVGGGRGQQPEGPTPPQTGEPGGDDPNLEFARRATDLALEHLKDQMDQDDSELLDRLGWTAEDAKKFIQKWEQMRRAAAQKGPEGEAARRQLDRALRSLGLRPRGTQIQGDRTRNDGLRDLREAGRFDPPSDWSELFRAYRRGVTRGGRR